MLGIKIGVLRLLNPFPCLVLHQNVRFLSYKDHTLFSSSRDCGKILKFHILVSIVKMGIKIGVFEAAESIPVLSFTPKCKVLDL